MLDLGFKALGNEFSGRQIEVLTNISLFRYGFRYRYFALILISLPFVIFYKLVKEHSTFWWINLCEQF